MLRPRTLAFPEQIHVPLVSKILFFPFAESVVSSVRHALTISLAQLVFQITVSLIIIAILLEIALKDLLIMEMAAHNAHPTVLRVFLTLDAITVLQDFI